MTVQEWIVFTPAQAEAAAEKSETTDFKVFPRTMDNPMLAGLADPVLVVGNAVAPARILNDPEYGPVWASALADLPIRSVDSDMLFLPPDAI